MKIIKWQRRKDDGIQGDNNEQNTLPSHLGAFFLSNSKRFKNKFIGEINELYINNLYYGDTNNLYKGKKLGCVR